MSHSYKCLDHGYKSAEYLSQDRQLVNFRINLDQEEKTIQCEEDECEKNAECYIIWSSEKN